ncbi:hypothetical protein BY996DRAFT_4581478 [Phakopsora pachyrhizi]|uniref:DNA polymerase n=1 Tax=Phakopsora pachyrhizi TaxID=170000 RepID=A0AAV0BST5_PHAPC|nr:hypothetical protein BY996DRAFT_4581478 [Phakopsora pachyrhizi]CAH7690508.1 hypothetical protein PPACK8108_LOCUS25876 [Phakopsora pachyrhizi]
MGSYRRGEETCGDIDIILTRDNSDGKDHSGILRKLHRLLKKKSIITYDLSLPSDIDGLSAKYMGLCCLMDDVGKTKQRRIDILCVPYNQIGAAYIYFTGNDLFNRSIRLKARHMGYRLTNHGLFKRKSNDEWVRSRGREEDDEFLVESRSEEEIFRVLDVKYL